jgi:enoyl-CoA hydratase/carnithine racemase
MTVSSAGSMPLLTVAEGIATMMLNRPDQLNALDYQTIDTLLRYFDLIEPDEAVRAVILTGSGRAFSAGADIKGFAASIAAGTDAALRDLVRRGQSLTRRIENFPKPVIAAVNGIAYGGGCEVVEACPLAIASTVARFAKPEINLGFPPPFGGTQRLPRLIGRKRALHMILTGDSIDADEAVRIGLVNQTVPPEQLLIAARQLVARISAKPAIVVSACLTSVTRGINLSIDEGLAVEAAQFARTVVTEDIHEGIRAFIERRPARFAGC